MSDKKQTHFMRLCKECNGIFGSYLGKETICNMCKKPFSTGGKVKKGNPIEVSQGETVIKRPYNFKLRGGNLDSTFKHFRDQPPPA